jgi:S-adenosylmethionine:tRNA ribosyltransferase-isomerase
VTLASKQPVTWECLVRPLKRLQPNERLELVGPSAYTPTRPERSNSTDATATFLCRTTDAAHVQFHWRGEERSFADVLEQYGHVPLPPYISREETAEDVSRYQTVFSNTPGAVAAPTAGLHMTEKLISRLKEAECEFADTTLFVGAGTFLPMTSDTAVGHTMHREFFRVTLTEIERIVRFLQTRSEEPLIAVGTTTLRTLESLHRIGLRMMDDRPSDPKESIQVAQWEGQHRGDVSFEESLGAVADWCRKAGLKYMEAETSLMIVPGIPVASADVLITNFHQPSSTLLMLVAAFTGGDGWRDVYREALEGSYRFLSYGDSSMLIRGNSRNIT